MFRVTWRASRSVLFPAILFAAFVVCSAAQDLNYTVSTSQPWTDTGMDLQPSTSLSITATPAASSGCDPAGLKGNATTGLPVPTSPPGALIARLKANGQAVPIGTAEEINVSEAGHLWFGVNAVGTPPCQGSFSVKVKVNAPAAAGASPGTGDAANSAGKTGTSSGKNTNGDQVTDIKGALSSAAQTWLQGQFGTGGTTSQPGSTSSNSASPGNGAANANAAANASLPPLKISKDPLDSKLQKDINGLPRRVNDQFQHEGDMVNFVIMGSATKVGDALTAADWHLADRDVKESVLKAALETYEKKAYLTMPMSDLYLFGRVQDYGYEQAQVYAVVASRHHFRIWKAPFQYNGQDVWVGAGTHDIGFEKDQRNGNVTHKIDPNVDGERENIGASLEKSGKVKKMTYYLPPNPVQDARNATGGGYHSDGRILVIELN